MRLELSDTIATTILKAFGGGAAFFDSITIVQSNENIEYYSIDKASSLIVHVQQKLSSGATFELKNPLTADAPAFAHGLTAGRSLAKGETGRLGLEFGTKHLHVEFRENGRLVLRRTVPLLADARLRHPLSSMPSKGTRFTFANPSDLRSALTALKDVAEESVFQLEAKEGALSVRALPKRAENFFVCSGKIEGRPSDVAVSAGYLGIVAETAAGAHPDGLEVLIPTEGPIMATCLLPEQKVRFLIAQVVAD